MGSALSRWGSIEQPSDPRPASPGSVHCYQSSESGVTLTPSETGLKFQFESMDPRSPSSNVVRTPLQLGKEPTLNGSPSSINDSFSHNSVCPSHVSVLRLKGLDPRSPSSNVVRTPLQLSKDRQSEGMSFQVPSDDTLSLGSVSSQDILHSSICWSEFSRDCSDPSALVSDDDISERGEEELSCSVISSSAPVTGPVKQPVDVSATECVEEMPKASRLKVFQEDESKVIDTEVESLSTPKGTKKPMTNRNRTPLTPLHNRTPNSILRTKQTQNIEKNKLSLRNVGGGIDEKLSQRNVGRGDDEKLLLRNSGGGNNENFSVSREGVMAQWD